MSNVNDLAEILGPLILVQLRMCIHGLDQIKQPVAAAHVDRAIASLRDGMESAQGNGQSYVSPLDEEMIDWLSKNNWGKPLDKLG